MKGDCNICANGKMPPNSATCVECGLSRKNYKPVTNADRIHAMTDEELAEFESERMCCPPGKPGCGENNLTCDSCYQCWLDWLKQEAEE